jgi:hypothetical protein
MAQSPILSFPLPYFTLSIGRIVCFQLLRLMGIEERIREVDLKFIGVGPKHSALR